MERPFYLRIAAIFCCVLFIYFLSVSMAVNAVFTEEIVLGGTIAATEAALGETTTVAMGSSGLTDQMRSAADAAGQSVQAWVNDRIAAYNSVASGSSLLPLMAVDLMRSLAYTPDGELIFSKEFADAFSSFMDWLIDNGDIVITGASDIVSNQYGDFMILRAGDSVSFDASPITNTNFVTVVFSITASISDIYLWSTGTRDGIFRFRSSGNFSVNKESIRSNDTSYSENLTVYHNADCYYVQTQGFNLYPSAPVSSLDVVGPMSQLLDATSTGSTDGLDVWNDADDAGVVIDPTALLGDAISGLQGAIANVGDYIGTIADVIAGVANPALPVIGVGDIPITIPADITIPINPAIPDERIEDVPATGENADEPYMGTGDYTLPLADFFPFCIPFDLYKMLSLLASSPVAPAFDYPFPLPGGGTYTIHVDLSDFDSVAQVLRSVETLAFCVGLGIVTKKLLFGS